MLARRKIKLIDNLEFVFSVVHCDLILEVKVYKLYVWNSDFLRGISGKPFSKMKKGRSNVAIFKIPVW